MLLNKYSFIFPINLTINYINNRSCREKWPSIKDLVKIYFNEYCAVVVLPSVVKI